MTQTALDIHIRHTSVRGRKGSQGHRKSPQKLGGVHRDESCCANLERREGGDERRQDNVLPIIKEVGRQGHPTKTKPFRRRMKVMRLIDWAVSQSRGVAMESDQDANFLLV